MHAVGVTPMLACPRCVRPCVLTIAGAVALTLLTLACLIDTQGPSPERRPIAPVNAARAEEVP